LKNYLATHFFTNYTILNLLLFLREQNIKRTKGLKEKMQLHLKFLAKNNFNLCMSYGKV